MKSKILIMSSVAIFLCLIMGLYLYYKYPEDNIVKYCELHPFASWSGPAKFGHPYFPFVKADFDTPCIKPEGWIQIN